jgi:hypothetical protein
MRIEYSLGPAPDAGQAAGFEPSHIGAALRFRVYSRGYL